METLGSQLESKWQDGTVWADRLVRIHRRCGYKKPFCWSEYGLERIDSEGNWLDWTIAYQGDIDAQHTKDWFWGLVFNGGGGCHWLPGYFNGDFNNGTTHWSIFKPLSNYLNGVDFRGMTQESYYPPPNTIGTVLGCSNSLVGVYGFRGNDRAYLYTKNLTNTWYYAAGFTDRNVPTPANESADITVKRLAANTAYIIQRWSTTETNPANQVKGTLTRTTDGSGDLVFPANWNGNGNSIDVGAAIDYDWAYKIHR